jgi:hypothetical protein
MSPITDALVRLDRALTLRQQDPKREAAHLTAALTATGDLQRAMILRQLEIERTTTQKATTP